MTIHGSDSESDTERFARVKPVNSTTKKPKLTTTSLQTSNTFGPLFDSSFGTKSIKV